jgi:hypothetical protein
LLLLLGAVVGVHDVRVVAIAVGLWRTFAVDAERVRVRAAQRDRVAWIVLFCAPSLVLT